MKRVTYKTRALSLVACATLIACDAASERNQGESRAAQLGKAQLHESQLPESQLHESQALSTGSAQQHRPVAAAAFEELEALDPRTPVPLLAMMAWHQKQNMMQHLVVIERIIAATAERDWAKVKEVARAIEASESERRSCEHMGAHASGFTQLALEFHDRAAEIGRAAARENTEQVLLATSHTVSACTACHAQYRQQIVDLPTWERLQASTGDSSTPHGHSPPHGH